MEQVSIKHVSDTLERIQNILQAAMKKPECIQQVNDLLHQPIMSVDEELVHTPVINEDRGFKYLGYWFEISECIGNRDVHANRTDRVVCWVWSNTTETINEDNDWCFKQLTAEEIKSGETGVRNVYLLPWFSWGAEDYDPGQPVDDYLLGECRAFIKENKDKLHLGEPIEEDE